MTGKPLAALAVCISLVAPVAGAARAGEAGERAEALVFGAAVDRFAAKQLPAALRLRGQRSAGIAPMDVTVTEARYCGAGADAAHGRLLAIVVPGEARPAGTGLTTPRDCQDKLEDVAKRIPAPPDAMAVVEVIADWAPSQLRLAIGDVAAVGPGGPALSAALSRTKVAGPLETIETGRLPLSTPRGHTLEVDLALSFLKGADGVLATLTVAGGAAPERGRDGRGASFLEAAGAPTGSDAAAGATFPFAQRLVELYAQDGPMTLEYEGQTIEVRSLQVSGGSGQLTVRGRATSRQFKESMRVAIESAGADLKVAEVRAEAELEDCGASGVAGLGCKARNTARSAAAAALTSGMTSRYRGQLLRALLPPPPFSFDLGGRHLTLRVTPTRARATAAGPVVYGRGDLE